MFMPKVVDYFKIDDPVGAFAVHGMGGLWVSNILCCYKFIAPLTLLPMQGVLAVGIFVDVDITNENFSNGQRGLLHGGGFYLLGVQTLAAVVIICWTAHCKGLLWWLQ